MSQFAPQRTMQQKPELQQQQKNKIESLKSCAKQMFVQQTKDLTQVAQRQQHAELMDQKVKELQVRLGTLHKERSALEAQIHQEQLFSQQREMKLKNATAVAMELHADQTDLRAVLQSGELVSAKVNETFSQIPKALLEKVAQRCQNFSPQQLRTKKNDLESKCVMLSEFITALEKENSVPTSLFSTIASWASEEACISEEEEEGRGTSSESDGVKNLQRILEWSSLETLFMKGNEEAGGKEGEENLLKVFNIQKVIHLLNQKLEEENLKQQQTLGNAAATPLEGDGGQDDIIFDIVLPNEETVMQWFQHWKRLIEALSSSSSSSLMKFSSECVQEMEKTFMPKIISQFKTNVATNQSLQTTITAKLEAKRALQSLQETNQEKEACLEKMTEEKSILEKQANEAQEQLQSVMNTYQEWEVTELMAFEHRERCHCQADEIVTLSKILTAFTEKMSVICQVSMETLKKDKTETDKEYLKLQEEAAELRQELKKMEEESETLVKMGIVELQNFSSQHETSITFLLKLLADLECLDHLSEDKYEKEVKQIHETLQKWMTAGNSSSSSVLSEIVLKYQSELVHYLKERGAEVPMAQPTQSQIVRPSPSLKGMQQGKQSNKKGGKNKKDTHYDKDVATGDSSLSWDQLVSALASLHTELKVEFENIQQKEAFMQLECKRNQTQSRLAVLDHRIQESVLRMQASEPDAAEW